MKRIIRTILTALFAIAVVVGLVVLGYLLEGVIGEAAYATCKIIAVVLLCVILLIDIASLFFGARYIKKKGESAQAIETELKERGAEIREDYLKAKRKLRAMRIWIRLYLAVILLMAACMALFSFDEDFIIVWLGAWYSLFVFFMHLGNGRGKPDFKKYAKREDYPVIYAIADRAAATVGVEGELHVLFLGANMDAGIARFGKKISLQLSVDMLAFCTEEELYQILLHEFAHIRGGVLNGSPADKFAVFLEGDEDSGHGAFGDGYFLLPAAVYGFEVRIYKIMSSILIEAEADKAMVELGDCQIAANALGKIAVHDCFYERLELYMGKPFYQAEEYPKRFTEVIHNRFLALLPEQEAFWRELVQKELQPRYGSHPIMRTRIEKLGVSSFDLTPPKSEGAYFEETVKVREKLDAEIYEANGKDYEKERERCYLQPLRRVEEWEQAGKPYDPSTVREIIEDLHSLSRCDEVIALCDKIIEAEKGGLADYAHFVRGTIRLEHYDRRGLEDVYAAIDGNRNYIDEGIEKIGAFCCRMGLQEELDDCRSHYVEYMQQLMDARPSEILSASNKLSACDLPAEIQERNRSKILEFGEGHIKRIFVVKKEWEGHAEYNYVIEFLPKTTPEIIGETMDKIFYLLDNAEERYALFLYTPREAAAVKKVKESCIYQKE